MRSLLVFLLGICLTLSPVFGQTIENYRIAVESIRLELLRSKAIWNEQTTQIANLEQSLKTARISQQRLKQKIEDLESSLLNLEQIRQNLETRTSALERSLVKAQEKQSQLTSHIEGLETQLIALSQSLMISETELLENEVKHVEQIEGLSVGYERRILVQRITIGALIAVLIWEAARRLLTGQRLIRDSPDI